MKKNILVAAIILMVQVCFAQTAERKTGVALYGGTIQYKGELGDGFFKMDDFQPAIGFSVAEYLGRSWDMGLMFTHGQVDFITDSSSLLGSMNNMNFFFRFKFYNGKIFKADARVAPYLFTGFGASNYQRTKPEESSLNDAYIPLGLGFRIRISPAMAAWLQCAYHVTMNDEYDFMDSDKENDAFIHPAFGLSYNLAKSKDSDNDGVKDKKDKCAGTPPGIQVDEYGCPFDRDTDQVFDYLDACPDQYGQLTANGCPDKDRDGITDTTDGCPDLAGPKDTRGCPDRDMDTVLDANDLCPDEKGEVALGGCPDKDADGIADKDDRCPDENGLFATLGCPDRDGDGIIDMDDLCPDSAGIAQNKGCPEVKEEVKKILVEALEGLQFESGRDVIRKSSYPVMDKVVKVMLENPSFDLQIDGHTDNTGDPEKNRILSEKRADAAAKYLLDHGIEASRIESNGYGETMPVADNKTKKGKARNRRVEFKIVFR